MGRPRGMSENRKPHGRHATRIHLYATTIQTLSTPHSPFSPRNTSRTKTHKITMPPIRRTNERRTPTSTFNSPSSSISSSSIIRDLPPYRRRERIPDFSLDEFGLILNDDDDYETMMTYLIHRSDLYSRTVTMRHLWFTSLRLRQEARRQHIEAQRIFIEMEGLGLQDELRGGRPSSSPSPEAVTRSASPYYPAPPADETPAQDDLSSYEESPPRSPTSPTTSLDQLIPPLGSIGNPIIISDEDNDTEDSSDDPEYLTARSTFTTPSLLLLQCDECTHGDHYYFECPQYICDHCYRRAPMHRVSDCPDR